MLFCSVFFLFSMTFPSFVSFRLWICTWAEKTERHTPTIEKVMFWEETQLHSLWAALKWTFNLLQCLTSQCVWKRLGSMKQHSSVTCHLDKVTTVSNLTMFKVFPVETTSEWILWLDDIFCNTSMNLGTRIHSIILFIWVVFGLSTLRLVFVFVNRQGWYDLDPHLCWGMERMVVGWFRKFFQIELTLQVGELFKIQT